MANGSRVLKRQHCTSGLQCLFSLELILILLSYKFAERQFSLYNQCITMSGLCNSKEMFTFIIQDD